MFAPARPCGFLRHSTESDGCGTRSAQPVLAKRVDSVLRLSHTQGVKPGLNQPSTGLASVEGTLGFST